MRFSKGERVLIQPLGDRPGRVIGSQDTGRTGRLLYLVRYEVGSGPDMRSESSLYVEVELKPAPPSA